MSTATITAPSAVDLAGAATVAAENFLAVDSLLARTKAHREILRQRVIDTFKAAGVTRHAGVLVSGQTRRTFSAEAALRIKDDAVRGILIVPTVPTGNVDAALRAGRITKRQYGQLLAEAKEITVVQPCTDDSVLAA